MEPQALIFDIDGTLWDSTGIVAAGYNAYLDQIGHPELHVTGRQLQGLFGRTMTEIADVLFAAFPPSKRYDMMRGCMNMEHLFLEADPCRVAYADVASTLRELAKRHSLYIVSNSQQGYPELAVRKLGIADLIAGTLCYGDTGTCKGQTIRTLMTRHSLSSAAYIGDTQGDAEASAMAGIPFVWCRYGFGQPTRYDAAVDRFADLLTLF